MSLTDFESHLEAPSPSFWCFEGSDKAQTPAFLAHVRNRVGLPPDLPALSAIDRLLGLGPNAIRDFYVKHDGVLMYEDSIPTGPAGAEYRAAGISFFAIGDWEMQSKEMREGLTNMGWPPEEMPDWLREGFAFGEIPHSGNYFVIQPTGENAGHIYYADHDAFEPDPIARTFEEFLDIILVDPANFLYRRGCYTRYSDGKTKIQWIPKQFVTA